MPSARADRALLDAELREHAAVGTQHQESCRGEEMPPWFADPHTGPFANDRSLTPDQNRHHREMGRRRRAAGRSRRTRRSPQVWPADGWQIEPDLIVRLPDFQVPARPAKNVIEWTCVTVPSGFTKDTWVTSLELKPSDLSVTHHICLTFVPHRANVNYYELNWRSRLVTRTAWRRTKVRTSGVGPPPAAVPGGRGRTRWWRADWCSRCAGRQALRQRHGRVRLLRAWRAGRRLPAVQRREADSRRRGYSDPAALHADRQRNGRSAALGLHGDRYSTGEAVDFVHHLRREREFAIPPGEANYQSPPAEATFGADAWIVQMMPHMHLRGKEHDLQADLTPTAESEIILNVPKYDFNWQIVYQPMKPILCPEGNEAARRRALRQLDRQQVQPRSKAHGVSGAHDVGGDDVAVLRGHDGRQDGSPLDSEAVVRHLIERRRLITDDVARSGPVDRPGARRRPVPASSRSDPLTRGTRLTTMRSLWPHTSRASRLLQAQRHPSPSTVGKTRHHAFEDR